MSIEERIIALGDIAILIGEHINTNVSDLVFDDSWNIAGFEVDYIETNFGWNFAVVPKPTLDQLEAIKASME